MKNKILSILLSAVVAFGLWLYVITVVSPESEKVYYDIPVVLQNKDVLTERGLMLVGEMPKVTLTLKSDRITLNNLNEANINVIVNVANIEKEGTHNLTYTVSYPGNIPENSVSVQSSSTEMIELNVTKRLTKTVPLVVLPKKDTDGKDTQVPDGYVVDLEKAQLTVMKGKDLVEISTVEVSGPESAVEQIHQAVIYVDLSGQTGILARESSYTLCNSAGEPVNAERITTNADKINLLLRIQRVKEITLKVDVIHGGGTSDQNIVIDPLKIQVAGTASVLEKLDTLTVGTVDLSEMTENTVLNFPIELPAGVENLTGVEKVTVNVNLEGLQMRTFQITDFSLVNIPESLGVSMITKALQVTVRGPADQIAEMTTEDLMVVVDITGATLGTAKDFATNIIINSAFSGVGAVGTYEVTATIIELVVPVTPTEPSVST